MKNDKLILEQEKAELEASLKIMREESEQLKNDLNTMKSKVIALSANVLLGHTAFEPEMTREEWKNKECHAFRTLLYMISELNNDRFDEVGDRILKFLDWVDENSSINKWNPIM